MKYKDILEGKGENYVLFSKEKDEYKILFTGATMASIAKQLNDLFEQVKNDTNRKHSNKTLVS